MAYSRHAFTLKLFPSIRSIFRASKTLYWDTGNAMYADKGRGPSAMGTTALREAERRTTRGGGLSDDDGEGGGKEDNDVDVDDDGVDDEDAYMRRSRVAAGVGVGVDLGVGYITTGIEGSIERGRGP